MELEAKLLASLEADIAANRLILPSLPEVALEVRRVAQSHDASVANVAAIIARDAAISARVLKVANSALLGGRRPVEDLRGAVTRLGLRQVCSLVNTLAIIQTMQPVREPLRRQLREIAEHSRRIAALGYALAADYTRLNPDEAMLAGLIHDIGKLPLLQRVDGDAELSSRPAALQAACFRLHGSVGALVLRSWNFPDELITVALDHEDVTRDRGAAPDLVDVVIVANLLARGSGEASLTQTQWADVPAVRKLGLAANVQPVSEERFWLAMELLGS